MLQQGVDIGGGATAGMVAAQGPSPSEEVRQARLMGGLGKASIRRPAVADEHAVEVRPQQVGGLLVASSGLNRVDGRLRRDGSPEPLQVAADLPPGFVRGDDRAVADLAQQFGIGQLGTAGGPVHGADQAARTDTDVVVLPQ